MAIPYLGKPAVRTIEQTTARLLGKSNFKRETEDEPFISGHSVSEHLQYMIDKYAKGKSLELARQYYFEIVNNEMDEIMNGRGKQEAFTPAPDLREFLMTVKENGIKIGLVTSGLYEKAMPEIISAFKQLNMGNPLDFYDCIITAGQALKKGQAGTLGELVEKIIIESGNSIRFLLQNGLELRESIERAVR